MYLYVRFKIFRIEARGKTSSIIAGIFLVLLSFTVFLRYQTEIISALSTNLNFAGNETRQVKFQLRRDSASNLNASQIAFIKSKAGTLEGLSRTHLANLANLISRDHSFSTVGVYRTEKNGVEVAAISKRPWMKISEVKNLYLSQDGQIFHSVHHEGNGDKLITTKGLLSAHIDKYKIKEMLKKVNASEKLKMDVKKLTEITQYLDQQSLNVTDIRFDPYRGTEITIQTGITAVLGHDKINQKIDRLKMLLKSQKTNSAKYVDLDYAEKVFIK